MIKQLRRLHLKLNQKKMSVFMLDRDKQEEFLNEYPEPSSLIERSYYQKKCQDKINGRIQTFLYDLISMLLFLPMLIKLRFNSDSEGFKINKADAVSLYDFEAKKLLPDSIKKEYSKIIYKDYVSGSLDKEDIMFIKKIIFRYPFSFYFLIKNTIRLAMYSKLIKLHKPKAIISYAEYSFTSSILTEYCRSKGISHINIMHGEKLFNIRDSFFEFDSFYVWDKHYIDLFIQLRADEKQFILFTPEGLTFTNRIDKESTVDFIDFKYYLAHPGKRELKIIAESLKIISSNGYKIKVRPHPLLLDMELISSYFEEEEIELPKDVTIEQSVLNTNFVIAEYSTVLNQGFNSMKEIVIDDVTNPENYKKLQGLNYIMISKPHYKLSEIIKTGYVFNGKTS